MIGRVLVGMALLMAPPAFAQEPAPAPSIRYGVPVDLQTYAQATPRDALRSICYAVADGDIEYLLAHLIAPADVDARFADDPPALKETAQQATPESSEQLVSALQRHLTAGKWSLLGARATSRVAGLPDVTLERIGTRWYMHNVPNTGR